MMANIDLLTYLKVPSIINLINLAKEYVLLTSISTYQKVKVLIYYFFYCFEDISRGKKSKDFKRSVKAITTIKF